MTSPWIAPLQDSTTTTTAFGTTMGSGDDTAMDLLGVEGGGAGPAATADISVAPGHADKAESTTATSAAMELVEKPLDLDAMDLSDVAPAAVGPLLPREKLPAAQSVLAADPSLLPPIALAGMPPLPVDRSNFLAYTRLGGMPTMALPGLPGLANDLALPTPVAEPLIPETEENADCRISAYAKLQFEDGEFYMNTYQLIIGRDLAACRVAMRREEMEARLAVDQEASAAGPKTPVRIKREESHYSKSIISESGGILRDGEDSEADTRRRRSRKASKKSKSSETSSHQESRRNSLAQGSTYVTYQPQSITRAETLGAVPVDPASLRPSPHDCPIVGIHPPASTPAAGFKAISRRHVKIAYNAKKYYFEAQVIGRNGVFVDEEFYYHDSVVPLCNGSSLQIGGVVVKFILPDVAIGETGAEQREEYAETEYSQRYSEGGKEMSFDFEERPRDGNLSESSEDVDDVRVSVEASQDPEIEEQEPPSEEPASAKPQKTKPDVAQQEQDAIRLALELLPDSIPMPPKKRGPGRPPKNGIMSKREQKLLQKEAQQREKDLLEGKPVLEPSELARSKLAQVGKDADQADEAPREKRKYTKRKPKEAKDSDAKEDGSGSQEDKEKKDKKKLKPPRSPTPTFNEADLTPEQLAKPTANYVNLIYDAISTSQNGMMSLPQIYRAIQRKYPFFVLKCTTNGWQSSVRHNLSQNDAFRKVERDGKGWMWAIVEGVSIEKEKKRRMTPPPQVHPQAIYTGHPGMIHGPPYPPGMLPPPPGYQYSMMPPFPPGQGPPYMGPLPPVGHPMGHHPSLPAHVHQPFPPPLQPPVVPLNVPTAATSNGTSTYSSPYAAKPPNAAPPQASPQQDPSRLSQVEVSTAPATSMTVATTASQAEKPATVNNGHVQPQKAYQAPVHYPQASQSYSTPQISAPMPSAPSPALSATSGPTASTSTKQGTSIAPAIAAKPAPTTTDHQPISLDMHGIKNAVEAYKARMIEALRGAVPDSDAIVNAAINRYFKIPIPSSGPENEKAEKAVTDGLKSVLMQMGMVTDPKSQGTINQPRLSQTATPQTPSWSGSAGPALHGKLSSPTIMRPGFASLGGNRTSINTSVPRPSMGPNGMKRSGSAGSNNTPASASPAPTPSIGPGINAPVAQMTTATAPSATPVTSVKADGPAASEAVAATAPATTPKIDANIIPETSTEVPISKPDDQQDDPKPGGGGGGGGGGGAAAAATNGDVRAAGQKRERDEDVDVNGGAGADASPDAQPDDLPDYKRLSTSMGPVGIKT